MQSTSTQVSRTFSHHLTTFLFGFFLFSATVSAQTFTVLHSFSGVSNGDGANPVSALVQGFDGKFYGTTPNGGTVSFPALCSTSGCGTVFKIDASGNLKILYSFCNATCSDGLNPSAPLAENQYGLLWGTTNGTIFKIAQSGAAETTVYTFCRPSDCFIDPNSLIHTWDGSLRGTTLLPLGASGSGTVFRLTSTGQLTTPHVFCLKTNCSDGGSPQGLIQASDGNYYGVTRFGGNIYDDTEAGTIFRIGPQGFATIYKFCSQANCADGAFPNPLVQGADGSLYATTQQGGANGTGTFFKITTTGVLTTLYNFCAPTACFDGGEPSGALVQGTDGNFYGGTQISNTVYNAGTLFSITPTGSLTTLHTFDGADGAPPYSLVQGTDGAFYGTANGGGTSAAPSGTVFRLNVGLAPFIRPVMSFGKVGARVTILGTNLSGTTDVRFNGTSAIFKVEAPTQIVTSVPAGATTGPLTVTTPSGELVSDPIFTVVP